MTTTAAKPTTLPSGPLPLQALGGAPTAKYAAAMDRLRGHGSNDALIPQGLFPELDAAREKHLTARDFLARRIQALVDQVREYAREDRARQADMDAAAAKMEDPPADGRTGHAERQETVNELRAVAWSAVLPLSNALDEAIAVVRRHERDWLTELRTTRLAAVRELRTKAEQALAAADLQERKVAVIGQWLMRFADDAGGFSISPPVVSENSPGGARGVVPVEQSLQRPWHRGQPWNEGVGAPERPSRPDRPPEPAPEQGTGRSPRAWERSSDERPAWLVRLSWPAFRPRRPRPRPSLRLRQPSLRRRPCRTSTPARAPGCRTTTPPSWPA